MAADLTDEARAGQDSPKAEPPFIFSSPAWLAFRAGQTVAGMSTINKATMSRGYAVKLRTAASVVVVRFDGDSLDRITVDRT